MNHNLVFTLTSELLTFYRERGEESLTVQFQVTPKRTIAKIDGIEDFNETVEIRLENGSKVLHVISYEKDSNVVLRYPVADYEINGNIDMAIEKVVQYFYL